MRPGTLVKPSPGNRWIAGGYGLVVSVHQRLGTISVLTLERVQRNHGIKGPRRKATSYDAKDWTPVDERDIPDTLSGVVDFTDEEWTGLSEAFPDVVSAFIASFLNPPTHSPKGYRL